MTQEMIYDPSTDPQFSKPYIDEDEWRDIPVKHRYIHGGFEGTETRFCFYFPEPEMYQGRFFQKLDPIQGPETSVQVQGEEESSIGFAISQGGYFVASNLGGILNGGGDITLLYRCCSACAEYSRKVAMEMYGGLRPYGYLYGGSGGAFKTVSCVEMTKCWDGAVPFVMGSPMSIPNMFTVRAHALRILRHKMPQIVDAVEPGGSGNPYVGLTKEEEDALREWLGMGFPIKTLCEYETIGEGALPVLTPLISALDPEYVKDFWTKPGYLGADSNGSAVRDRIHFQTTVTNIYHPNLGLEGQTESINENNTYGVDEAWKHLFGKSGKMPVLVVDCFPKGDIYPNGLKMRFLTGKLAGEEFPAVWLGNGSSAVTSIGDVSGRSIGDLLRKAAVGDKIEFDNSDYIAFQTYHRHQVPDMSYYVWNQFRDECGNPIYPQRSVSLGEMAAAMGAGSIQHGTPNCKMIVLESLMDESAFPWQADWYRRKVAENHGGNDSEVMRLWYMEHCMHTDCAEGNGGDRQHIVSYIGALQQALIDIYRWVEKGAEPAPSTSYRICDGQVILAEKISERGGIQPGVLLLAEGAERIDIAVGEEVKFSVKIDIPVDGGSVAEIVWDFEKDEVFLPAGEVVRETVAEDGVKTVTAKASHVFEKPGIYFPVVKVAVNRNNGDIYTNIRNQARVRVVVK